MLLVPGQHKPLMSETGGGGFSSRLVISLVSYLREICGRWRLEKVLKEKGRDVETEGKKGCQKSDNL